MAFFFVCDGMGRTIDNPIIKLTIFLIFFVSFSSLAMELVPGLQTEGFLGDSALVPVARNDVIRMAELRRFASTLSTTDVGMLDIEELERPEELYIASMDIFVRGVHTKEDSSQHFSSIVNKIKKLLLSQEKKDCFDEYLDRLPENDMSISDESLETALLIAMYDIFIPRSFRICSSMLYDVYKEIPSYCENVENIIPKAERFFLKSLLDEVMVEVWPDPSKGCPFKGLAEEISKFFHPKRR